MEALKTIFLALSVVLASALYSVNAKIQEHEFVVRSLSLTFFVLSFPFLCPFFLGKVINLLPFVTRQIQATPVKRLCNTHNTITVNGQFPGPTLEVNNGDTLVVKVTNKARYNVTIHWYHIKLSNLAFRLSPLNILY